MADPDYRCQRVCCTMPRMSFEQSQSRVQGDPYRPLRRDGTGRPLPLAPDGYCFLLVVIHRASRWIEGIPMKAHTPECLLSVFLLFVWRRGCPKLQYSDRGGNLLSFLAHIGSQRLGVTTVLGSAYGHWTSGLYERAIRSLLTMLTCDMAGDQHHLNWLERLHPIFWSLNTSISAATGCSPFFLEHGREPREIVSRAMDTSEMPAVSAKWAEVKQQHLGLARKVQRTRRMLRHGVKLCLRKP